MTRLVLYLTNDQLIVSTVKGGTLVERQTFPLEAVDGGAVGAHLRPRRHLPVYLVTDLIEEDFRLDTVPHLRGADREALLSRKLAQIYRASNYRHAIVQGREEDGRRDDKVFYHAVTNGELLKPLLGLLAELQTPLEGIYSSAVLSGRLLQALDLVFPHTLLVTIVPLLGLRQTYFQGRHTKFSRLTHIVAEERRSAAQQIAAEIGRTWQYLDSLRYFGDEDSLEICVLIHEHDRAVLQQAIANYPLLRYRFLDIGEVAAKLGIQPAPSSSQADGVLSALYAKGGLDNHFADSVQTQFARFRRGRIGIFSAAGTVLAAGAAAAGFNLFQASRVSAGIEQRNAAARVAQTEYQGVLQSMKQQKAGTDTVRDTAIFFNSQIRPAPAAPGDLLREIAEATAPFPQVQLLQVVWGAGNKPVAPTFQATALPGNLSLASEAKAVGGPTISTIVGQLLSGGTPDTDPPLPGNKLRVVLVEGVITDFSGDYRAMLRQIEDYRRALAALPDCQVDIVNLPVEFDSRFGLKSQVAAGPGIEAHPRFVLKLVKTVAGT